LYLKENKRAQDEIEICFEVLNQLAQTDLGLKQKYDELRDTEFSIGILTSLILAQDNLVNPLCRQNDLNQVIIIPGE